jgi:hypothetical protein
MIVYLAMLVATIAGQLAGITADVALGHRVLWVPLGCSVVLESIVGARFGAARVGRALTPRECVRLSGWYSIGLGVLSLPLAGWTLASNPSLHENTSVRAVVMALVLALAGLVAATAVRNVLMVLLSRLSSHKLPPADRQGARLS